MAERTVVSRAFTFPVPESLDDETAAALPNPGVSAWLSLAFRARLAPGEDVLILGATGVTGRLAVKIAKLLGAARVVAAGRNPEVLSMLSGQGADATIRLDLTREDLAKAFTHAAGRSGFQVVIDYVWGEPAEAFMAAVTRQEIAFAGSETRYVQVGESAGPSVLLPAAVLRSTALTIMGTAGIPPSGILASAFQQVMTHAASGELRIDTERISLAEVARAWQGDPSGRRWVIIPRLEGRH